MSVVDACGPCEHAATRSERASGRTCMRMIQAQCNTHLYPSAPVPPQDFLAALILSECVYKKVELSQEGLATAVSSFASLFPEGWVQLGEWGLPGIGGACREGNLRKNRREVVGEKTPEELPFPIPIPQIQVHFRPPWTTSHSSE